MEIKEFQAEFAKVYAKMRLDIDCNDIDVHIWQNEIAEIIVNFDIR